MFIKSRGLFLAAALGLASCATNSYLNAPGHGAFMAGNYESAGMLFESEIPKTNINKLLFFLDAGTSYFNAANYDKAIPLFLQAVKFWESKDYTSITEEAGKLAISENVKTYVGEDYERVLIHVYLALSYLAVNKVEDAQVEARRIDLLLKQMRDNEKKNYKESSFARYLSALLWEGTGNWDSARVDYEQAIKIDPTLNGLRQDLLRACIISGDYDRYDYWKKRYPGEAKPTYDKTKGEVIILTTYGLGPIRVPNGDSQNALPKLMPRPWTPHTLVASTLKQKFSDTHTMLDMEDLTKKFFEEKLNWLAARKVITLGVKAGVAYGVAKVTKNEGLGWLTFLALAAMDTTDLRGWNTLPAGVRMLRVPLNPGIHSLDVEIQSTSGAVISKKTFSDIQIKARKKVFLVLHEGP